MPWSFHQHCFPQYHRRPLACLQLPPLALFRWLLGSLPFCLAPQILALVSFYVLQQLGSHQPSLLLMLPFLLLLLQRLQQRLESLLPRLPLPSWPLQLEDLFRRYVLRLPLVPLVQLLMHPSSLQLLIPSRPQPQGLLQHHRLLSLSWQLEPLPSRCLTSPYRSHLCLPPLSPRHLLGRLLLPLP